MKLQNQLNKFIFLILLVSANLAFAGTKWEVATLFLGSNENESFQKDVDQNILELNRVKENPDLKLGIYRENNGQFTSSTVGLKTNKSYTKTSINLFLKSFFKDKNSKRALIIYSHGKGAEGLKDFTSKEIQEILSLSKVHFDLMWFDACYMANMEFLFQLRKLSDFTIASEDAEFTSGLPFESLNEITQVSTGKEASLMLAKSFIESYSYLKNGTQKENVNSTSATVSVIDNKNIENLAVDLKIVPTLFNQLPDSQKTNLKRILTKKYSMDENDFVDLGSFLIELRKIISDKEKDKSLTNIIRKLNIDSIKKLRTNPRIHITVPSIDSSIVFGFNHWENGSEAEYLSNDIFKNILKNDQFMTDQNQISWPTKKTPGKEIILTPFAPAINSFDYYFINNKTKKILTRPISIERKLDLYEKEAVRSDSPILYSAYTQEVGSSAEKYTGINISILESVPSLDYFECDFNQLVHWLKL